MNIHIQDVVLKFENNPKNMKRMFSTIKKHVDKKGMKISYFIIDGNPIYENFYSYINKNNMNIQKVEVVLQTVKELVNETLLSADKYIKNALPLITKLAEEFYQQSNEKTWSQVTDLFEGLQWIIQTLTQIDSIKDLNNIVNDYRVWNEYVQVVSQLNSIIPKIESAMINKENSFIGDILTNELVPVFKSMLEKLQNL